MMRRTQSNILSVLSVPLCIIMMLLGLFGMVRLRSNVVSVSYDLRALEEKKTESIKEMKMLLAERAKVISLASLGAPFHKQGRGDYQSAGSNYVFPERVKVIHMKKHARPEPFRVSLETERSK